MNVFVTVGAQMPFDRLVHAVDRWAEAEGREDIFAQVGDTLSPPRWIPFARSLPVAEFHRRAEEATVLVAHAGMGSIITALELGKPILVLPRRADLRETRNDHQLATAERLKDQCLVEVAFDDKQLQQRLAEIDAVAPPPPTDARRLTELVRSLRHFLAQAT